MPATPTDHGVPAAVFDAAVGHARRLIDGAHADARRDERVTRRRLRRLFLDDTAVGVTLTLTDEVMRFRASAPAAQALRHAARRASRPGFGVGDLAGLRAVAALSHLTPSFARRVVGLRVRALTRDLILDAAPASLERQGVTHRREGLALNVNVLGEAVLGEREADDRLARVIAMMRRPDVTYVSVKVSAIVSQLTTLDHAGSSARVCAKLRILYREAQSAATFVNLDLEEYRDLRLTLQAFTTVLSEPEFHAMDAGIVLQAYLPDAHDALDELIGWARMRHVAGGGVIKVRLVKGANLAMEHVESELHGWTPATYDTKSQVDASYLRLLDVALRPAHAPFLRVGAASHNLFHVAWALELAKWRGVAAQLDVEMLEGMANAEARALTSEGHAVLLYAPVTRHDDFASAIAYLVRRFDENTSPENYLRAALDIAGDERLFEEQRARFADAARDRHSVDTARRRRRLTVTTSRFENEPDGDPTDDTFVLSLTVARDDVARRDGDLLDTLDTLDTLAGAGAELPEPLDLVDGIDPSAGGRVWYHYRVATHHEIDLAVARARTSLAAWRDLGASTHAAILRRAGDAMSASRARSIAVMGRDGGKTVSEADPEVSEGVDFARFYADQATALADLGESAALGVVLVVPPWNFPYAITAGGILAAVAAGNTVIVKPAPETTAVAYELVSQLWDAGVPRDVLQMVPTRDDECGRHLVTHEGIDAVVLTGSYDTAAMFTAWKPALRLLGETSGKNAIVVTASADVDLAVRDLVHSAFSHAGQKCSAASLAILTGSVYENSTFLDQLVDAVTSLRVGPSYDPATHVGPLIHPPESALERALQQLDDGESWLVEPRPLDDAGFVWRPGVKIGVRPGSWSHLNEWFGPVLAIMVARNLDEALDWQNATPYALTGGLHSLDTGECEHWIERVEVGNLYVNRTTTGAVVARQPFGGWRRSRVGPTAKAGGENYVNCLRDWPRVVDTPSAIASAAAWWREKGSMARDNAELSGERNLVRYRRASKPVALRVDAQVTSAEIEYLRSLCELAGVTIDYSSATLLRGLFDVTLESVDEFVARSDSFSWVRWISDEEAPTDVLVARGVRVDTRTLAQCGAVELPRWLLEQSVAITNHRYGNLHAGPKPNCPGLGVSPRHPAN